MATLDISPSILDIPRRMAANKQWRYIGIWRCTQSAD